MLLEFIETEQFEEEFLSYLRREGIQEELFEKVWLEEFLEISYLKKNVLKTELLEKSYEKYFSKRKKLF